MCACQILPQIIAAPIVIIDQCLSVPYVSGQIDKGKQLDIACPSSHVCHWRGEYQSGRLLPCHSFLWITTSPPTPSWAVLEGSFDVFWIHDGILCWSYMSIIVWHCLRRFSMRWYKVHGYVLVCRSLAPTRTLKIQNSQKYFDFRMRVLHQCLEPSHGGRMAW
jgi:hypothetical protein